MFAIFRIDISKQAVAQRFNTYAVDFLKQVLNSLIKNTSNLYTTTKHGVFDSFGNVYLGDSTSVKLPRHLADLYPGTKNQSKKKSAGMKIQAIFNLKTEKMADFGLSAYIRTDQTASMDIFKLLKPDDLIIRDLGYFVFDTFRKINQMGAFFLSRFKSDIAVYCPKSGERLNLLKLLKKHSSLDIDVLMGVEQKLRVRLVAMPVPDCVANQRRRKAKNNRDQRWKPSKEKLAMLGWQIFITNVSRDVWDSLTICRVYTIRWRIEIIFKAWKSHLCLNKVPGGSKNEIDVYIYCQLMNLTIFYVFFDKLNQFMIEKHGKFVSILKVAPLFRHIVNFINQLNHTASAEEYEYYLEKLLLRHCCYEDRADRINYGQYLRFMLCLPSK